MKRFQITLCFIVLITVLSGQTLPTPTVSALGNTLSCDGNGLVLQSSASSGNQWSNSLTTQTIHVMNTGTYNVTQVTGTNSSASSAAITVSIMPSASISPIGPICITNGQASTIQLNGQPQAQPSLGIYGTYSNSSALMGSIFDPLKANWGPNNVIVYTVMYKDSNNTCYDTTSLRITVQNCTSLSNIDAQSEFKIFPNPGNGHYVIQSSSSVTEIKVFNLIGHEIESVFLKNDSQYHITVNAPAGVYFLRYNCEQKSYVSRVIKMN